MSEPTTDTDRWYFNIPIECLTGVGYSVKIRKRVEDDRIVCDVSEIGEVETTEANLDPLIVKDNVSDAVAFAEELIRKRCDFRFTSEHPDLLDDDDEEEDEDMTPGPSEEWSQKLDNMPLPHE